MCIEFVALFDRIRSHLPHPAPTAAAAAVCKRVVVVVVAAADC